METLVEEILTFFPDFKITVSDVKTPSGPFVLYFFVRVLSELGVDVDHVQRVQMYQLDSEEIDIIPKLNLVTAVRTAMPFLNFTLGDLLFPDFKRLMVIMRDVMKFLQFCEQRCGANNAKVEAFQEAKLKERQLAQIKEAESKRLNQLAMEVDSSQQTKLALEENIAKLKNEVERYQSDYKVKEQQIKEVAGGLSDKQHKMETLERELQAITDEIDQLKKLIVSNPEDEKNEFDNKSRERDRVIQNKKEYQDKYQALRAEIEKVQKQAETWGKLIGPILNELPLLEKFNDLKNADAKAQKSLEELNKRIESFSLELSKAEAELQKVSQKESESKQIITSMKDTLEQRKSDYKNSKAQMSVNFKKSLEDLEKVQNNIKSIESDYSHLLNSYNAAMRTLDARMNEINFVMEGMEGKDTRSH